jgi:PAP2 superfamily
MCWYPEVMARVGRAVRRCYSVEAELAIVALVLLAWHAVRIPLEGGVGVSLEHAADVLRMEGALSLDVEPWVIAHTATGTSAAVLGWLYANIHLPVLFGFIAAARMLAPARYPAVRTTFVLSFLPAVLVIGLFPLAPPHWLPQFGLGFPPTDGDLTATTGALFHNVTAAAASQHFGFAAFLATTAIWLFPRSWVAWTTIAYPVLVFVVIVGTGNHYVLDCVVGSLTFVLAASVAYLVHRPLPAVAVESPPSGVAAVALGYALVTWGFVSLELTMPSTWHFVPDALALLGGTALVVAPRLAKEALAETS